MTNNILLAAATLGLLVSAARAQPGGLVDVPIVIGGTDSLSNACDEGGTVVGLDPHGDGFLSVRSGPGGRQFREIDRVYNGMHVEICDERGPWLGVVYAPSGEHDGCNVEHAWPVRQPYTGPCRYGWVLGATWGIERTERSGSSGGGQGNGSGRRSSFQVGSAPVHVLIRC